MFGDRTSEAHNKVIIIKHHSKLLRQANGSIPKHIIVRDLWLCLNYAMVQVLSTFPFAEPSKYLVRSLGCWADTSSRAIPSLEGKHALLKDSYKTRTEPYEKCLKAALDFGWLLFQLDVCWWKSIILHDWAAPTILQKIVDRWFLE